MTTTARCRIALQRLEADDPRGHALQLGAAMLWCFLCGIGTTPEGIGWGLMLAVSIVRLPKSWRSMGPALCDAAWIMLVLWWAWGLLSLWWAIPEVDAAESAHLHRWLLTPLLLWPVAGRVVPLLASWTAGTMVQVIATLVMSWGPDGLARYTEMSGLTNFWNLGWDLTIAFILVAAAVRFGPGPIRLISLPALALAGLATVHAGYRFSVLAIAAALTVLTIRPRGGWRQPAALLLPTCLAAAATVVATRGGLVAIERVAIELDHFRRLPTMQALHLAGGQRVGVALTSLELAATRPWFGSGKGSFAPLARERHAERVAPGSGVEDAGEVDSYVGHPHNIYLLSWVEGGVVSVLLVTGGLWTLAIRLWRRAAREPIMATALAVYGAVLVGSFVSIIEFRTPGGLIALCMAISRNPCSLPRDEVDGT